MIECDLLLVGSSIFEAWTGLDRALPDLRVVNRAVGGTETHDWLERLSGVLDEVSPRGLALYCGSNDLGRGKETETVIQNTLELFHQFHTRFPDAPIAYHSIIKAPEKQHRWPEVDEVNREVELFLLTGGPGTFIDLNPLFFSERGHSRLDRFVEDRLHLTEESYHAMNRYCAPRIEAMLNARTD